MNYCDHCEVLFKLPVKKRERMKESAALGGCTWAHSDNANMQSVFKTVNTLHLLAVLSIQQLCSQ